jgi:aryl-alcohol dehydrogenase-like predicted oxidoreductase
MTRPAKWLGTNAFGKPVCRLGLAGRIGSTLTPDDVRHAIARGVTFLNWPGEADEPGGADAVSETIAELGAKRDSVVVCVQFGARTAADAANELRTVLATLRSDYVDVLTLYYVEQVAEWDALCATDGALEYLAVAKRDGVVRRIGVSSHQRKLAAAMGQTGRLDALMIRYNAAHRGAEQDVFPITDALGIPVIAYTALRWGALMRPTPDDPPGFVVPSAVNWYRFTLHSPSVAVALSAPACRAELDEDLRVLDGGPLSNEEFERLALHGRRVRRHAGGFP